LYSPASKNLHKAQSTNSDIRTGAKKPAHWVERQLCASIRREAIFLLHLATAARSAPLTPQAIGMIAAQYGGVRFV
jgi:hypothetical protein